jgi:hypothetical protein
LPQGWGGGGLREAPGRVFWHLQGLDWHLAQNVGKGDGSSFILSCRVLLVDVVVRCCDSLR